MSFQKRIINGTPTVTSDPRVGRIRAEAPREMPTVFSFVHLRLCSIYGNG